MAGDSVGVGDCDGECFSFCFRAAVDAIRWPAQLEQWFVAIIRTDSATGSVAAAALLRIVFEFGLTLRGDGITAILVRTDLIRQYRFCRIGGLSERRLGRCASHGALVSRMRAGMSNVNNPTY
jgi:hypothetical protein